ATFDRFLDSHRQISEELRGDPSRVQNPEFLERYPDLQDYLQSHPAVRKELNENPNGLTVKLLDGDKKTRTYQVVAMTPASNSEDSGEKRSAQASEKP